MQERVRICDIAEELGLSTATVSNVIHGKTNKVSDETVQRVTALLEKRRYIPSMAGILLARNSSGIIGVFVNDHPKYEGHTLRDGFLASALLPLFVCEASWSLGENVYAAIYGRMGTEQSAAMTLTAPIQGLVIGALENRYDHQVGEKSEWDVDPVQRRGAAGSEAQPDGGELRRGDGGEAGGHAGGTQDHQP